MVYFSRSEPDNLLALAGRSEMQFYRHPKLDLPYYQELRDVWPAWKSVVHEDTIYNQYFSDPESSPDVSLWQILAESAKGRPVFQECRTSGRIQALRQSLDGYHIFLWRNPWDQWWSYKVSPYFDTANQAIINAPNAPLAVQLMLKELCLNSYAEHDLKDALDLYDAQPISSENSYLIFYMLWCLSMREGLEHAHLLVNIDHLSESASYREEIEDTLTRAGIEDVDFSDCHVPQGTYSKPEQSLFLRMESKVHRYLRSTGWSESELDRIVSFREDFEPQSWKLVDETPQLSSMREQVRRAHEQSRRSEDSLAARVKASKLQNEELEAFAKQEVSRRQEAEKLAEQRTNELESLTLQTESRLKDAEARAAVAESELQNAHIHITSLQDQVNQAEEWSTKFSGELADVNKELEATHKANHLHWEIANSKTAEVEALRNSLSWRLTAPARWPGLLISADWSRGIKGLRSSMIHWGMSRPWLVDFVHMFVDAIPPVRKALTQRIADVIDGPAHIKTPSTELQKLTGAAEGSTEVELSYRERQFFDRLEAAVILKKKRKI